MTTALQVYGAGGESLGYVLVDAADALELEATLHDAPGVMVLRRYENLATGPTDLEPPLELAERYGMVPA